MGENDIPFIPYGRQWIDEYDRAAVDRVLTSDYLTTGPEIGAFEAELASYTGARYAVAVSSATAGLHLALAALDLPTGSSGITSPNTFVATPNSLVYNGLVPKFADIDPLTYNLSAEAIGEAMDSETSVLLPVHFAGRACDMAAISKIASARGVRIVEDAAHAIGSRYPDGSMVGSCRFSDMTVFSFHPVKTMTTGEGGAVTTNDKRLYQRLLDLRSHGITRDRSRLERDPGPWYYEMHSLGYNYRMTDIQAALGRSQLSKLELFVTRRRELVRQYNRELSGISWLVTPDNSGNEFTSFHLYVTKFDWDGLGLARKDVMAQLRSRGIGTQVLYIPVHTQPYYRESLGFALGDFPVAEAYYQATLALPLYAAMSDDDQYRVVSAIRDLEPKGK
mgnify:CR=1 FL=1